MNKRLRTDRACAYPRQQGAMLITVSLFFITLSGLAALAFDLGHLLIVRNELQNAADAAALAGANCLNKTSTSSGTDCTSTPSSTLNWSVAGLRANAAIGLNQSDGTALVHATVTTGYKNLAGTPAGLQTSTPSPVGVYDKPAVMVSLSRSSGSNGGAPGLLLTAMFNVVPVPISATAVAVISSPGRVGTGSVIPHAINQCMFDQYWDPATNSPKLATSTALNGVPQTLGQPWELRIGSSYHYPNCDSGQWTSFGLDVNDVPSVRDLITNGNPVPLALGDSTWVQPGTKTTLYGDLEDRYPSPPGADVTLIVVNLPNGLANKGTTSIVGFAGFHITAIMGGSGKYIQGHFIKGAVTGGSSGIGPYYGTYTPPRLAQ
jgi:Flp pilus assembly protein TadG